ncbi:hypothetical protein HJ01_02897 [Flavobacterium frigoris PS1]|uniref:Uncharacterized protein n=1 Tax=Flavobacterium frigoris (strain PS1) TaxID=1086011 RepID=H7FUQ0_FLAFP|nr:hypothetical protein HJ01_02897 [Flavobacterium frigoris PS1]
MLNGIFSSFWMVLAIFNNHLALFPKFLTLAIYGINTSKFDLAKISILGKVINSSGPILFILESESWADKTTITKSWYKLWYSKGCFLALYFSRIGSNFISQSFEFSNKSTSSLFKVY